MNFVEIDYFAENSTFSFLNFVRPQIGFQNGLQNGIVYFKIQIMDSRYEISKVFLLETLPKIVKNFSIILIDFAFMNNLIGHLNSHLKYVKLSFCQIVCWQNFIEFLF